MDFFIKCLVLTACTVVQFTMSLSDDGIEQGNKVVEEKMLINRDPKTKEDAGMHAQDRIKSGRMSSRGVRAWNGFKRSNKRRTYTIVIYSSKYFAFNKYATGNVSISMHGELGVTGLVSIITLPVPEYCEVTGSFLDVGNNITMIVLGRYSGQHRWYPTSFNIISKFGNKQIVSSCDFASACPEKKAICSKYIEFGFKTIQCQRKF